jgi:hypothetical protein
VFHDISDGFLLNEAKEGGAVGIFFENTDIDFILSSFYGNVAGFGGAVLVSDGNQWTSFSSCLFEMNAAIGVGGALAFNSGGVTSGVILLMWQVRQQHVC